MASTTTREPHQGLRRHKLLTAEARRNLPPLRATEGDNRLVHLKFFSPYTGWRWYAVEGRATDDGDFEFFGLVVTPQGSEFGYFVLSELAETALPSGTPAVERDCWWTPCRLGDVRSGKQT